MGHLAHPVNLTMTLVTLTTPIMACGQGVTQSRYCFLLKFHCSLSTDMLLTLFKVLRHNKPASCFLCCLPAVISFGTIKWRNTQWRKLLSSCLLSRNLINANMLKSELFWCSFRLLCCWFCRQCLRLAKYCECRNSVRLFVGSTHSGYFATILVCDARSDIDAVMASFPVTVSQLNLSADLDCS